MSRFTDLLPSVTEAIDAEFGESLRFLPWKEGKYTSAGGADLARPARTLTGTFSEALGSMSSSGDDAGFRGEEMPTSTPLISFDLSLFPSTDDWPREGDHIVRLEAAGTPAYQVGVSESDGVSRLYVHLTRL